jgi:hypothetical protein
MMHYMPGKRGKRLQLMFMLREISCPLQILTENFLFVYLETTLHQSPAPPSFTLYGVLNVRKKSLSIFKLALVFT